MSEEGPEQELSTGMLVGRYQLLFRLGKGGMGEVWAAAQSVSELGFQKLIALKVLRTKEMTSNAAIMFLDEAKAAAALQHAAIVPTVDLGRDGDILFLAMDMVRGPSLTALLQKLVINKKAMSPAIVAYIGTQIASALDYAHDRATFQAKKIELIHRDVSPHNVLLDLNGAVRLTDFGVARTTIQTHESHVGTVRGKPSYMAPEQVVGGDIDARTDLFSLGIVLYESSSLKRLFGRSNPVKSMDAVLKHQPRSLLELVPGFPEPLWRVIDKALQKDPTKRHQNAAELVEDLTEASRHLAGAASAARDLCTLIKENFAEDAFEIDGRVNEALLISSVPSLPAAVPSIDEVRVGPAPAPPPVDSATRAMRTRPRSTSGSSRSGSSPALRVRPQAETFASGASSRAAWPSTGPVADPLAPEAIEEARTRFASLTPSGISPMNMASVGSMESMTPLSASSTGASILAVPAKQRSNMGLLLGTLSVAALLLLGAAFVVVSKNDQPVEAQLEPSTTTAATETAPVRATKVVSKAPEPPPAPQPQPELPEGDADLQAKRRAAPPAKRPAPAPVPVQEAQATNTTPPKPATNAVGPNDGNATKAQVLDLIRQVKKLDPEAAKQMYPVLSEAGEDNIKVLNELRAKAKAILAQH